MKSPFLERIREAIRVRHYSIRTERTYVDWTRRFIVFHDPAWQSAAVPAVPRTQGKEKTAPIPTFPRRRGKELLCPGVAYRRRGQPRK